ncbi:MAG: hypothetical protein JO249_04795 [Acidobacteria bacterium]|nr:hypothetical protein [Acidobacteriota bacterium]
MKLDVDTLKALADDFIDDVFIMDEGMWADEEIWSDLRNTLEVDKETWENRRKEFREELTNLFNRLAIPKIWAIYSSHARNWCNLPGGNNKKGHSFRGTPLNCPTCTANKNGWSIDYCTSHQPVMKFCPTCTSRLI